MHDDRPVPPDDDPLAAVTRVIAGFGVGGRALREVVARLTERAYRFDELIRDSGLSRRTVEDLLGALGPDLIRRPGGEPELTIAPERRAAYRDLCRYEHLARTRIADPLAERMAAASELVGRMGELVAAAPVSRKALDHVAATPETAVRRAVWLDGVFELAGRRLLCVGDHDLTSLAVCQVNPAVAVTVVDIDERILEFIDVRADRLGLDVRCLHADLRFGLPAGAAEQADLVVTDPPYTPEGVRLFLARGLAGLRDRENARLVMAYGFGERHPALGLKVQRAAQDLHLACEAILPDFNRYVGAQAVGSSSDLYVFRPTAKSWSLIGPRAEGALAKNHTHGIYTHGPQSLEAAQEPLSGEPADALIDAAAAGSTVTGLTAVAGPGWPDGHPRLSGVARLDVGALIGEGLPRGIASRPGAAVAADLSQDPGPWLLRALLAVNATRLALLVPNNHPDVANAEGQRRLTEIIAPKYALRFRRSFPTPRHCVVEATAVPPDPEDPGSLIAHALLSRAHGKLGNVWREALIRAARTTRDVVLTKNQARTMIEKSAPGPGVLDLRLIELPRHRIRHILATSPRAF
ncbi:bis-aminopropyl spermidine synthase family protein [Thermopolyspora sp. NPDC052614]|uniref:bis-aminopropyl spermidine synthase family protein n=1 Tax=Thermopolyspora sp. NPDC052614 TaxID=3155682 RepID=UPI003422BA33